MKFFVLSLVLLSAFAPPAFAQGSCVQRLRAATHGQKQSLEVSASTERLARKALSHYRSELASEGVYLESISRYSRGEITVGYKVSITDGGDESRVDYILDATGALITAYWHNQTPQRYWLCE
jgi:hypothetical protein